MQSWLVMGESFALDSRYRVMDYLGSGAYGTVCAAHDNHENCVVAIKKCKKIFQSRTLAKRTLREVKILRLLDHENIVKIKSIAVPIDIVEFNEIYIVLEIMETDLAQIIRSPQTLRDEHVQCFLYQITKGLEHIHSAGIVHRDLKPRNILVNSNCQLKIADFGLARVYNGSNDTKIVPMTEYITTRWYRAPEILVGWNNYTSAVDMWALGTITAELISRTPLLPGGDSVMQLDLTIQYLGKPPDCFIKNCKKLSYRQYLQQQPVKTRIVFSQHFPTANPQCIEILENLLQYEPNKRYTASETLNHAYLNQSNRRKKSTKTNYSAKYYEEFGISFQFEDEKLSLDEYKTELLNEVYCHNPDTARITLHIPEQKIASNETNEGKDPSKDLAETLSAVCICGVESDKDVFESDKTNPTRKSLISSSEKISSPPELCQIRNGEIATNSPSTKSRNYCIIS